MKSIVVFCGSSLGNNSVYETEAALLGATLAKKNIRTVYGGAKIGIMGALANAALEHQGEVYGVIPEFLLKREVFHEGLTELAITGTMHERKAMLNELSDGIITLPGGYGTMEEIFEMLTWEQLKLHQKPIGILNTNGFYNHLLAQVQHMVNEGFLQQESLERLHVSDTVAGLLEKMEAYDHKQK